MNQNPRRRCFTALKLTVIVVLLSLLWGGTFSANGAGTTVAGCTELLQNGGFEAGAAGWQEYSVQGYSLISDFNPRTGRWSTTWWGGQRRHEPQWPPAGDAAGRRIQHHAARLVVPGDRRAAAGAFDTLADPAARCTCR